MSSASPVWVPYFFNSVSRMFQGYFVSISRVFYSVSRTFQESFKNVLRVVQELSQDGLKGVLRVFKSFP